MINGKQTTINQSIENIQNIYGIEQRHTAIALQSQVKCHTLFFTELQVFQ